MHYGADIEKIIYANLVRIGKTIPAIVEGAFYRGVQSLADASIVLRVVGYVHESQRFQSTRGLNRQRKLLFDKHNIGIPFPQSVVHDATPTRKRSLKEPQSKKKTTPEKKESGASSRTSSTAKKTTR